MSRVGYSGFGLEMLYRFMICVFLGFTKKFLDKKKDPTKTATLIGQLVHLNRSMLESRGI